MGGGKIDVYMDIGEFVEPESGLIITLFYQPVVPGLKLGPWLYISSSSSSNQTTNTDLTSVSLYSYLAFLDLQRNGELLKAHNVEVE